jgi:WD40 repeat protein
MSFQEVRRVNSVAVSPDGRLYASGQDDGTVRVGDLATGAELLSIRADSDSVTSVAFLPDGGHIVSGGESGSLALWNAFDGSPVFVRSGAHENWTMCTAIDRNGARIFTGGGMEDNALKVWDRAGNPIAEWGLEVSQVDGISQSSDGQYLALSYWDRPYLGGERKVTFPEDTGVILLRLNGNGFSRLATLRAYGTTLPFAKEGYRFFTYGGGCALSVDASTQETTVLPIAGVPLCLSTNEDLLVVQDRTPDRALSLRVWHLPARIEMASLHVGASADPIYASCCACFSPDGSILIGGSSDGSIRFWDTRLFIGADDKKPEIAASPAYNKLTIPEGMRPNPEFGKEIRRVEQKVSCKGLVLVGVKGLRSTRVAWDRDLTWPKNDQDVLDWFRERGAIVDNPGAPTTVETE